MNIVRQLLSPSLALYEITGQPVDYAPHVDLTAQFSLALEGVLIDHGTHHRFDREPGSITFRPAGTRHSVVSDAPARGLCIEFSGERFPQLCEHAGLPTDKPVHMSGNDLSGLGDQIYFELRGSDRERPVLIEGLVTTLVARFATLLRRRNLETRPPWLDDAVELIRTRSRVPNLSATYIAARIGVATADLNAALAHFERVSLHDLLQRHRVDWAREQLRCSRRAIAAIAQEAGFYDNSHMVRAFRRIVGTTPSAYRRAYARMAAPWIPPIDQFPVSSLPAPVEPPFTLYEHK